MQSSPFAATGGLTPEYPASLWSSEPSHASYDSYPFSPGFQPSLDMYDQDASGQMIAALMGPSSSSAMTGVTSGENLTSALLARLSRLQAKAPLDRKATILASLHCSLPTHARSANGSINTLYKTELCRSWQQNGSCRYGNKCQFAHGPGELRTVQRHPKYKTELCRTFTANGSCPYGSRCRFIHLPMLSQQTQQAMLPPATMPALSQYSSLGPPLMDVTAPINNSSDLNGQAQSLHQLQLLHGLLGITQDFSPAPGHLPSCDFVLSGNHMPPPARRPDLNAHEQRLPVFQGLTEPGRSTYLPHRFTM